MQNRASARWPSLENDCEPGGFPTQPSNPSYHSSADESVISPVQVDGQAFDLVEFGVMKELHRSIHFSLASPVYPGGSAHETISPYDLLRGSGSIRQFDCYWGPETHPDHDSVTHQPHYPDSTVARISEPDQGLKMPETIDLFHEAHVFRAPPNPLQDGASSQGINDTWSSLGDHPTSGPYLVFHNHPSHEGYENPLCLENGGANFRSLTQQHVVTPWFGYGNDHLAYQYPKGWSTCDGRQPVPAVLTRAPVHATFGSEAAIFLDPQAKAQPRIAGARSLPECTQFTWNSKTGGQLTSTRTKRRQSEEEKASTRMLKRLGGSCDACRRQHRKVTFPKATLLLSLTCIPQCSPSHARPAASPGSEVGAWAGA
jgi:hypothetical protein